MISAPVRVISTEAGTAFVMPTAQSGCGGCQSRESCGISGLGKYFSGNRKAIKVDCEAGVHPGEELQVSLSEGDLIKAGLLAYLLPCMFALIGAGVSTSLGFGDVGAALGAGAGMAAGFAAGRLTGWVPHIVAHRTQAGFQSDLHR